MGGGGVGGLLLRLDLELVFERYGRGGVRWLLTASGLGCEGGAVRYPDAHDCVGVKAEEGGSV